MAGAMTALIMGVLLLYLFQTYLPSVIMHRAIGAKALRHAGGSRDAPLPLMINSGRAKRALMNMNEAMFVCLPLSLSSLGLWMGG